MAFFPIMASSDNRQSRGAVPTQMRNVYLEPAPEGASKRSPFLVVPTPGAFTRVTPASGKNVRGLFMRPGVAEDQLYAVCGDTLYRINKTFTATSLGFIAGAERVVMDNLGANLGILANNTLYITSGVGLTTVTDANFPPNAFTLASLADRFISSQKRTDQFDWSAVGDGFTWPALGFASSARAPDEIVAQIVLAGDLWHFGSATTQIWRAQGGSDEEAFDVLSQLIIDRGIYGRDAIAKMDSTAMWIGDDKTAYELNVYTPNRVPNRDLEIALQGIPIIDTTSTDYLLDVSCFAFMRGSHLTWVANVPGNKSFAFDALTRKWHERTSGVNLSPERYEFSHYALFDRSHHCVAGMNDDTIYTWEDNVYTDGGNPIERIITLHIPFSATTTPISNITLDMKTFDQPLVGQGSDPEAMISFSRTGGTLGSIPDFGIERTVKLGVAGKYGKRPTLWRLGAVNAADGFLLRIRITDPVGFALSGVWVNELPKVSLGWP